MKLFKPIQSLLGPLRRSSPHQRGANATIDDQISARTHGPYGDASGVVEPKSGEKQKSWFGAGSPRNVRQEKRSALDKAAEEASENEGMAEHAEKAQDPQLWDDGRGGRR